MRLRRAFAVHSPVARLAGILGATGALALAAGFAGCDHPRESTAPLIRITARDYEYSIPDRIPAGLVRLRLVNRGPDIHEAVVVRFADDVGSAAAYVDSVRAKVSFPSFATDLGGVRLVVAADSSESWLDLAPGRYAVVCWKGDHLERGMAHDFEVVADSSGRRGTPPKADIEVLLSEFAFQVSGPLIAGAHLIHSRNIGRQPHEVDIFRLPPGRSVKDYTDWADAGEVGIPPAVVVHGAGDLVGGREIWSPVTLTPGRYFMICLVSDSVNHRPHAALGMIKEFEVR